MKKILLITMTLSFGIAFAQTVGDIAFVGYNADGDDDFAFVALVDITVGTEIHFSDNEWGGTAFNDRNEGILTWTASAIIHAGTIIIVNDASIVDRTVNIGTLTSSGSLDLGASNEALFAYTGADKSFPSVFLAAICNDLYGSGGVLTGTNLTLGVDAIDFGNDNDGFAYVGSRTGESSFTAYASIINNVANWADAGSDGEALLPFSSTKFLMAGGQSVGFDTSSGDQAETNATFSISIPVTLVNYGSNQVDLSVKATNVSAEDADYALNTSRLTFTTSTTQNILIDINADEDYADEVIQLTLLETTSTGVALSLSTFSLTINDDDTPSLVISEFLADPDPVNGDANGDGEVDALDDEFIEIVNIGATSFDLSSWVIADGSGDRHTFPTGTVLSPSKAIVVFGGGNPSGTFSGAIVQVASFGSTSFNNVGDNIKIKTPDDRTVINVTYRSEGGNNESITLSPDLTGTFTGHSTADTDDASLFSPGTMIDGTAFGIVQSITWDGSESRDWVNPANWDLGIVPTSVDNVTIVTTSNDPIICSDAAVNNINISTGEVVIVESGASLAIFGTSSGTGELLVKRKSTGSAGYSILGTPVKGASLSDLSADYLYGYNSATSTFVSASGSLDVGKGYFVGYDATTPEISLKGTPVSGTVDIVVDNSGEGLNLIANPYAASISIKSFLSNSTNTSATDGTIYLWDDGGSNVGTDRGGDYITVNNLGAVAASDLSDGVVGLSGSLGVGEGVITSTQGFFVKASATSVQFESNMQSVVFTKNKDANHYREDVVKNISKILLSVSGNGLYNETLVGFTSQATLGKDYSLDALKFAGSDNISFYSVQADNNYAIQALPSIEYESVEIELAYDLTEAGEYTLTIKNLSGFNDTDKIQLLDNKTKQLTDVSEGAEYGFYSVATQSEKRFTLIVSPAAETLTNDKHEVTNLSIFTDASVLNVQTLEAYDNVNIKVLSLNGAVALEARNVDLSNKAWSIPFNKKGLFIIAIETKDGLLVKKFLN